VELVISYDMRAPAFGAPARDLYAAALDQVQWADELGFDVVGLGEHHASPDGYNPSPLVLASAMGARTRRIRLRTSVLLAPLYDPIKLAEDAAVTQLATAGRLILGIGGGYRPAEFETFGQRLEERWRAIGETIELLRKAWTGEPFTWKGRRCHVTPRPDPAPPILLGGASAAAARRAARIADGWFPPLEPRLWAPYREECVALGKADPGEYPRQGPIFLDAMIDADAKGGQAAKEPDVRADGAEDEHEENQTRDEIGVEKRVDMAKFGRAIPVIGVQHFYGSHKNRHARQHAPDSEGNLDGQRPVMIIACDDRRLDILAQPPLERFIGQMVVRRAGRVSFSTEEINRDLG
jgi:alkanesulfonate monooxygenase SsuD/methylene tetrahydromethanopterin reductase-like flavin-dependent oxidoreductase (luciferase family)